MRTFLLLVALAAAGCLAVPGPDSDPTASPEPGGARTSSPSPQATQSTPGPQPSHVALLSIESSFNLTRQGNDTAYADYGLHCVKVQHESIEGSPGLRIVRWGEWDTEWSHEEAVMIRYDAESVQAANGTYHTGYNARLVGLDKDDVSLAVTSPLQGPVLFNVTIEAGVFHVDGNPLPTGSSTMIDRTYEIVHKDTVFRFEQTFTIRAHGTLPVVYETRGACY